MRFTKNQLQQLQKNGKIRNFTMASHEKEKTIKLPKVERGSKEKDWIAWNLMYWCNEHSLLQELENEYRFDDLRKWRFDHAIKSLKIAIEYEGLFSEKSRHTTAKGFTGDADKYNRAQQLGWKVLRYTSLNYKNLITDLNGHTAIISP